MEDLTKDYYSGFQSRGLETPPEIEEKEQIIDGIFDVIIFISDLKDMSAIGLKNAISEINNVTDVKLRGVNDKIIATIEYEAVKEDVYDDYFTVENKIENEIDETFYKD